MILSRITLIAATLFGLQVNTFSQKEWISQTPVYQPIEINSIANGKKVVAVGNAGVYLTTPDGESWTQGVMPGKENLNSIVWTSQYFVAVGNNSAGEGISSISTDGISWTLFSIGKAKKIIQVTWSGSRFVALDDDGLLFLSTDAKNWTPKRVTGDLERLRKIVWHKNQFIGLGERYGVGSVDPIRYLSRDGLNWKPSENATSIDFNSLNWMNNYYVFNSGYYTHISTDLLDWTNFDSMPVDYFSSMASTGKLLIGTHYESHYTSTNGEAWTLLDNKPGRPWEFENWVWTGSLLISISKSGIIYTSADGIEWKRISTVGQPLELFSAASSKTINVTVGEYGAIFTSTAGGKWLPQVSGTTQYLRGIVWGKNQFVSVGDGGTILTSPNGIDWVPKKSGVISKLSAITWTGTNFVAVGEFGKILISSDGTRWSKVHEDLGNNFQAVTWGNNVIVAIGLNGVTLRSNDLQYWYPSNLGTNSNIFASTVWNGSKFFALGLSGYGATSIDGTLWDYTSMKFKDSVIYVSVSCMTWDGKQFVAVGVDDEQVKESFIYTSNDGDNWKKSAAPTLHNKKINSLTWTGQEFLAIGEHGSIFVTPKSPVTGLDGKVKANPDFSIKAMAGALFLTLPSDLDGSQIELSIFSSSGARVYYFNTIHSKGAITLPMVNISKGRYLLQVKQSGQVFSKPFLNY